MMIKLYDEDKKLLNDILERNYYYYFKKEDNNKGISISFNNNNNYNNSIFNNVKKYNDIKLQINNLEKFIEFYKRNNFLCDFYIEEDFWLKDNKLREIIFNIFLNNFKNNEIEKNIYIPTDFYKMNKEDFIYFQNIINNFNKNNINIIFIGKFNGKYCEIDKEYDNYDLIFKFISDNDFLIKAEINPKNVLNWKKNFIWITENFNNFDKFLILYEKESELWDEQNIKNYIDFLDFYISFLIENNNNFLESLFNNNNNNNNLFNIISLSDKGILDNSNCNGNCKLYNNLHIILNDLSITICKKIQYEELTIGNYVIENNKISYCNPMNISALMIPAHLKRNMTPHCEYCPYIGFCPGFCHGDSYYKSLNPLISIRETCLLRTAKYNFIFFKLLKSKKFDIKKFNNINFNNSYYAEYIIELLENLKRDFLQKGLL